MEEWHFHFLKYGQIVFLAGGAGSGKGFARDNFMEKEKFKIRDVDEWKTAYMKMADLQGKHPEIKGLNLKNPKDVYKIHMFIKSVFILLINITKPNPNFAGSKKNKKTNN